MNVKEKLNYFEGKFDEINREKQALSEKDKAIAQEWMSWLKEQGMPDNFHIIQLVKHFRKDKEIIV